MVLYFLVMFMCLIECDVEEVDYIVCLLCDGVYEDVKIKKWFCCYVQQVGIQKVYFKEVGDLCSIDLSDGKENMFLLIEEQVIEVIYFCWYNLCFVYGIL